MEKTIYYIEHVLHNGDEYIAESITFGTEEDARKFLVKNAIVAYQITKQVVILNTLNLIAERLSTDIIEETDEYRRLILEC